jgi:hypothetical protein
MESNKVLNNRDRVNKHQLSRKIRYSNNCYPKNIGFLGNRKKIFIVKCQLKAN